MISTWTLTGSITCFFRGDRGGELLLPLLRLLVRPKSPMSICRHSAALPKNSEQWGNLRHEAFPIFGANFVAQNHSSPKTKTQRECDSKNKNAHHGFGSPRSRVRTRAWSCLLSKFVPLKPESNSGPSSSGCGLRIYMYIRPATSGANTHITRHILPRRARISPNCHRWKCACRPAADFLVGVRGLSLAL